MHFDLGIVGLLDDALEQGCEELVSDFPQGNVILPSEPEYVLEFIAYQTLSEQGDDHIHFMLKVARILVLSYYQSCQS